MISKPNKFCFAGLKTGLENNYNITFYSTVFYSTINDKYLSLI